MLAVEDIDPSAVCPLNLVHDKRHVYRGDLRSIVLALFRSVKNIASAVRPSIRGPALVHILNARSPVLGTPVELRTSDLHPEHFVSIAT